MHSGAVSIFEARNKLIEAHLSLVRPIAVRVARSLPRSFELDDLIGAGYLGLVEAARRYRPREYGGTPFSAYARAVVRGFILSSIRRGAYVEATRPALSEVPEPMALPAVETEIDSGRLAWRVRAEVKRLPRRHRSTVDLYYRGRPLRSVGERVGVGRARAGQLHQEALAALRARLCG